MKKLSLSFDALKVETFDTTAPYLGRGTVHGNTGYISECYCTGGWCEGESTTPCQAGTYGGNTCDSTCNQIACGCTGGGPHMGTCDLSCGGTCNGGDTCVRGCDTFLNCPTTPGYPGC